MPFLAGLALGILSWAITPLVSDRFEPFDSGWALLIGQAAMSLFAGYVGFRHGLGRLALAILGLYLGQLGYSYVFGGPESQTWIMLGAVTILLLCVLPGLTGLVCALARRLRAIKNENR